MTSEQAVAHVIIRSTVVAGELRIDGRAPVRLAVSTSDSDVNIDRLIDVSKW